MGSNNHQALPLYDLFLDLPHPAAAASSPPAYTFGSPENNSEIEKELSASISRISQFAFPEYDDSVGQRIPRNSALNRFSQYAMQPKSFQNYTFSLQLHSGVRVHGFVRRYLPIDQTMGCRYDVGRRGERALVMLTRFSGGDSLYSSVLKTIDAISFHKAALDSKFVHPDPEKWFLNRLFEEHQKLCRVYSTIPQEERKPMMISVRSLELGKIPVKHLEQVDTANYLVPTSLLAKTTAVEALTSSPILPLLRVLGVSSTLRLLSALLSENRVLLISANPTRLAQCARSALSILAQGLLNWQHLYIPVLPPHLFQYIGAPVPYLIGILKSYTPKLNQMNSDGLGEMVIINLDNNQMETRGMNPVDVARKIPDLFQKAISEQGMPETTASEVLAQDLLDLLKMDKRALYGESTLTNVSETAAKATKAVKSGINTLARKGKRFFNNRKGSASNIDTSVDEGTEEVEVDRSDNSGNDENMMTPDVVYIQGCRNEIAEEEARIAFSSFFLSMFGNMRWYLSASPGKLPHLDRNRFLQQKRAMGEGESSPIWPLLQNLCNSQMLEQFAKARVDEVRLRLPVTSDSPLFSQCANYHRLNNIDFSVMNVRRVARQIAQTNPSRLIMQTSARRMTMLLTSNKTFEGDYNKAVAQLVEQSRECTSALFDIMSVIWVRIRDSKGVHWKHGLQALQVLRNLLYHGPIAAVAESTDGLDKIRAMKFYNENMRSQICTQIRKAAHQVYNLLVDRAKLFHIRRICANKRRLLIQPEGVRYAKDPRISILHRFGAMHQLLNPVGNNRVAPAPNAIPISTPGPASNEDIFGLTSSSAMATGAKVNEASATDSARDILDLFGNFDISIQSSTPSSSVPNHAQNTFAQLPIENGQVPTPSHQTLPPSNAFSKNSMVTRSHVTAVRSHDPFSPVSTPKIQADNFVAQYPHAPPQQTAQSPVDRSASQGSHATQTHVPQYSQSASQRVPSTNTSVQRDLSHGSHAQRAHVPDYHHAAPQQIPFASQSSERNLSQGSQIQQGHMARHSYASNERNLSQGSQIQQGDVPRHSHASHQQALFQRNLSQESLTRQAQTVTGTPVGYAKTHSQQMDGSAPPQQNNTHLNRYHSNSSLQYNPSKTHSGLPSHIGYSMERQQQQNNQGTDNKHRVSQIQHQQQHSFPPTQQKAVSVQTPKSNLSQFDPFQ